MDKKRSLRLAAVTLALAASSELLVSCGSDDENATFTDAGAGGSDTGTGGSSAGTKGSGGVKASGGAKNTGGSKTTGGAANAGGAAETGGTAETGGAPGTGGAAETGGAQNTGGAAETGGAQATGGAQNTGGAQATGGAQNTGGGQATGGSQNTGGAQNTGGSVADASTDGSSATGGAQNTGGAQSTGGATSDAGVACGNGTIDSNEDCDYGNPQPVGVCTTGCKHAACYLCEGSNAFDMADRDACLNATGNVGGGGACAAAGQTDLTKSAVCLAILDCVRAMHCSNGGLNAEFCYCGDGVSISTCSGRAQSAETGPCRDIISCGAESSDPTTVTTRARNPSFAVGLALQLVGDDSIDCASTGDGCFP